MAELVWSFLKDCWAKTPCAFIIWNSKQHLFQQFTTKSSLFHHCPPDQVSFRPPHFSKSCYTLDRVCFADHYEVWIVWNGCALSEKSNFKVSYSNMFVLSSLLLVWNNENYGWICDEHVEMFRVICLFSISAKISFQFVGDDEHCSTWTHKP